MNLKEIFILAESDLNWGKIHYSESFENEDSRAWLEYVNGGKVLGINDIKEEIIRREKRIANAYDFETFHELNDVINDILNYQSEDLLNREELIRKARFLDYIQNSISKNHDNYQKIENDILKHFSLKKINLIEDKIFKVNELDKWLEVNSEQKSINILSVFSINNLNTVEKANLMLFINHALKKDNMIFSRDIINATNNDEIVSLPATIEKLVDLNYISEVSE